MPTACCPESYGEVPIDEQVTNIEDRVWEKEVIEAGYTLAYDPEAAVFHHHGLHQGNDEKRASGVVSILESVDGMWFLTCRTQCSLQTEMCHYMD